MNGRATRHDRILSRLVQVTFLIVLLALWYLATTKWGVSHLLLPNPVEVYDELKDVLASGEFIPDLRITLTELAGVYSIPIILFLPLYVLFFGLGPASKIALGTTISFFPIVLNTIAGFGYVDRIYVVAARSMGASSFQLFRWVLLPAALPVILTGLRMGFIVALLSILGSETIASLAGLGHRIVHLAEAMDTARMFAYIAFAVARNTAVPMLEVKGRR